MAACLATGGLASHRSAAALFRLRRVTAHGVEITVGGRRAPRLAGVRAHRSDSIAPPDRTTIAGIPVTSPARILVDLAGELTPSVLEGALDDALVRKLTTLPALGRVMEQVGHRRPGVPLLAELVAARRGGDRRPTESQLEDDLGAVIRRFGLPEPVRQYELELPGGHKVRFDTAYPSSRLAFEADGDEHHAGVSDQARDAVRDERCRERGWNVRRFTTEAIRQHPADVAAVIAALLRALEPSLGANYPSEVGS
jgi:very-short-patch-repair endonuclease